MPSRTISGAVPNVPMHKKMTSFGITFECSCECNVLLCDESDGNATTDGAIQKGRDNFWLHVFPRLLESMHVYVHVTLLGKCYWGGRLTLSQGLVCHLNGFELVLPNVL